MKTKFMSLPKAMLAVTGSVTTLLSLSDVARGATISGGSFQKELELAEISHTETLSKFDSSLGTLTAVNLTLSGEFMQMLTATNTSTKTQKASLNSTIDIDFSIVGLPDFQKTISLQDSMVNESYAAGESVSFSLSDESSQSFELSEFLSFFRGLGEDFEISCASSTLYEFSMTPGGNTKTNLETTASCGASIEYTFIFDRDPDPEDETTIPEPSTLLGILAVAGIGALVRRKS
jgi:hypothetical protein